MTRFDTVSTISAALLALSVAPGAVAAQASATAAKSTSAITIEVDPWMVAWKKESSKSRIARANIRALNEALDPYRTTYADLTDHERSDVRSAFGDLIPGHRFTTYRINAPQARAIAHFALGATRGRRQHRCEYSRAPEPAPPAPAPVLAGEPTRPGWCEIALDSMSRDAAWINMTILSLSRSGAARRTKTEELTDLRSMADRARGIVVSTSRCGCRIGDDGDALLTSTREAVHAVDGSSVPAWMTLRSEHVQRISKLSDAIERSLLRCLSNQ